MIKRGKSWWRWLDECKMAAEGVLLASRELKFVIAAIVSFFVFGTLMVLLSGSTAALNLFWVVDVSGKVKIIGDALLGLFGVGQSFWDWALIFSITVLQSILIGLVVLVWQKKRSRKKIAIAIDNSDNIQSAGLVAGLAVLGSGCPTCGTTLLAPILGTLFSTAGYTLASALSGILMTASLILALFMLKKMGNEAYAIIISEKFQEKSKINQKESKTTQQKPKTNQEESA